MTDELSPFVYKYLTLCLQQCLAWAEGGCQASLQEVAMTFPSWPHAVPFDVNALAVVLGESTDLANASKVAAFRAHLNDHLCLTSSFALQAMDPIEPWYNKDMAQFMCELLVLYDVSLCPRDLTAILVQSIIDYGRDAIAVIGFLLCARMVFRWGRCDVPGESEWLVGLAGRAIRRADEYLLSEHVGDFNLLQLVQDIA